MVVLLRSPSPCFAPRFRTPNCIPSYTHPVPHLPNSATLCQPGRFDLLTATTTLHHLDPIRLPLPAPPLKHGQRVRLRVEDPLVEWQEVLVGEEEEEVFEAGWED